MFKLSIILSVLVSIFFLSGCAQNDAQQLEARIADLENRLYNAESRIQVLGASAVFKESTYDLYVKDFFEASDEIKYPKLNTCLAKCALDRGKEREACSDSTCVDTVISAFEECDKGCLGLPTSP